MVRRDGKADPPVTASADDRIHKTLTAIRRRRDYHPNTRKTGACWGPRHWVRGRKLAGFLLANFELEDLLRSGLVQKIPDFSRQVSRSIGLL